MNTTGSEMANLENEKFKLVAFEPVLTGGELAGIVVIQGYAIFLGWLSNFHESLLVLIALIGGDLFIFLGRYFFVEKKRKKTPVLKMSDQEIRMLKRGKWTSIDLTRDLDSIYVSKGAIQIRSKRKTIFSFLRNEDIAFIRRQRHLPLRTLSSESRSRHSFYDKFRFFFFCIQYYLTAVLLVSVIAFYPYSQKFMLSIASQYGNTQAVALLLSFGADVNAEYEGRTPLSEAKRYKRDETVKYLIERGAN